MKNKEKARILKTGSAMGVLSGFINGFLGAGGGIILMWMLPKLDKNRDESDVKDDFATVVAIILLYSTVSAVVYSQSSSVETHRLWLLCLPGMAGGAFGAYLTDKLNSKILKNAFCVLMIVAGVNMLLR